MKMRGWKGKYLVSTRHTFMYPFTAKTQKNKYESTFIYFRKIQLGLVFALQTLSPSKSRQSGGSRVMNGYWKLLSATEVDIYAL